MRMFSLFSCQETVDILPLISNVCVRKSLGTRTLSKRRRLHHFFPGLNLLDDSLLLGMLSVSESTRAIALAAVTSEMSATFGLCLQP